MIKVIFWPKITKLNTLAKQIEFIAEK